MTGYGKKETEKCDTKGMTHTGRTQRRKHRRDGMWKGGPKTITAQLSTTSVSKYTFSR